MMSDTSSDVVVLQEIVARNQVWPRMAAKYGVENPVPPWKTSLDGLCDALDQAFLEDMIPHHGMAVMMSQQLLARGLAEHQEVTDLATAIRDGRRCPRLDDAEVLEAHPVDPHRGRRGTPHAGRRRFVRRSGVPAPGRDENARGGRTGKVPFC